MTNLFSSFDPGTTILGLNLRLNWLRIAICLIIAPQLFWLCNSQWSKSLLNIISYLLNELGAVFGNLVIPGTVYIYISIFFFNFHIFFKSSYCTMIVIASLSDPM